MFRQEDNASPSSIEAEQALLGILLYDNSAVAGIGTHLKGEHFFEPLHQRMFGYIMAMIGSGRIAEPIMVDNSFKRVDRAYDEVGGLSYLGDMVDRAPPTSAIGSFSSVIFDLAQRRELLEACLAAIAEIRQRPTTEAFVVASSLRKEVERIETGAAPEDASMITAPAAARKMLDAVVERQRVGKTRGLMTGLRCIDRRLSGLRSGKQIVIGSRPGMGKTALLRAILSGAARRNPEYEFVCLGIEMDPEEMVERQLSAMSQDLGEPIEYKNISGGALIPTELQLLYSLDPPPNLHFDNCPVLSLDDVRRKVWGLGRKGKVGAVGIDYLQIMQKPDSRGGRSDTAMLGEITAGTKQIARQANTCMILLSQLNRTIESRDDKKPQLADLRESGSIEQDADVVLFPYRPIYYLERSEPPAGPKRTSWVTECETSRRIMDVICAKQRAGPTGYDRQMYFAETDTIRDWAD